MCGIVVPMRWIQQHRHKHNDLPVSAVDDEEVDVRQVVVLRAPVATANTGARAASPKLEGLSSSDRYRCRSLLGAATASAESDSTPTCMHAAHGTAEPLWNNSKPTPGIIRKSSILRRKMQSPRLE